MMMQLNHGLQELDLSYNEVSSRGALVLAQALECNDYLTSLQVFEVTLIQRSRLHHLVLLAQCKG
jgi:hypothetical protein